MIYNHLNIFFLTTVEDLRIIYHDYSSIESKIDCLLAESRFWLGGKKIKLFDKHIEIEYEKREFKNTLDKIKSIVLAILLVIPGIILKACLWSVTPDIFSRDNQIFNSEQHNFFLNRKLPVFKAFKFNSIIDDQKGSFLLQQPDVIVHKIIGLLDGKDKFKLAASCKKNYYQCLYYKHDINDLYPKSIIKAFGKNFLEGLTRGMLPAECHDILNEFKNLNETLDVNSVLPIEFAKCPVGFYSYCLKEKKLDSMISSMSNQSVQSLITTEGEGLMIRMKNNDLGGRDQLVILLKFKNKWMGMCFGTSGGTWALWNDLRFYDDNPVLEDYLKRLKEGKPCGSFPNVLNQDKVIDYKTTKASDVLVEGPRVCSDGITPVIQLWKPFNFNI